MTATEPARATPVLTACAYAEAILVAVLLALFARAYLFEAFEIPSGSMERTLLVGDHVLVDKSAYAPHRGPWRHLLPYQTVADGDVVVFRSPEDPARDLVKRVVGLPAEAIRLSGRRLARNGVLVDEPHAVYGSHEETDRPFGPVVVAPGTFLAFGDNRDDSRDSRVWGPVPEGHIKGRALFVYWSRREPETGRFTGRGAAVRRFLDGAVHFFERTRWDRTFLPVR